MEMEIKRDIAISESGLVFNPITGLSFTTNPIGCEIIKMLKAKATFPDIQEHILTVYDVSADEFQKDFEDFVNWLRTYELVAYK
jgi:hypothetical protein